MIGIKWLKYLWNPHTPIKYVKVEISFWLEHPPLIKVGLKLRVGCLFQIILCKSVKAYKERGGGALSKIGGEPASSRKAETYRVFPDSAR